MSDLKYILKDKKPIVTNDVMEWGKFFENSNRRVGLDVVNAYRISTTFLGLDHSFGDGEPLLFETMIFSDKEENKFSDHMERYSTWEQAEEGHKKAVEMVKQNGN